MAGEQPQLPDWVQALLKPGAGHAERRQEHLRALRELAEERGCFAEQCGSSCLLTQLLVEGRPSAGKDSSFPAPSPAPSSLH